MPRCDFVLPSFDELVKLHQAGVLDAYIEKANRDFMDAIPEGSEMRRILEQLQFQIQGVRARHQGLGRVVALTGLMNERLLELNASLHAEPEDLVREGKEEHRPMPSGGVYPLSMAAALTRLRKPSGRRRV